MWISRPNGMHHLSPSLPSPSITTLTVDIKCYCHQIIILTNHGWQKLISYFLIIPDRYYTVRFQQWSYEPTFLVSCHLKYLQLQHIFVSPQDLHLHHQSEQQGQQSLDVKCPTKGFELHKPSSSNIGGFKMLSLFGQHIE